MNYTPNCFVSCTYTCYHIPNYLRSWNLSTSFILSRLFDWQAKQSNLSILINECFNGDVKNIKNEEEEEEKISLTRLVPNFSIKFTRKTFPASHGVRPLFFKDFALYGNSWIILSKKNEKNLSMYNIIIIKKLNSILFIILLIWTLFVILLQCVKST